MKALKSGLQLDNVFHKKQTTGLNYNAHEVEQQR